MIKGIDHPAIATENLNDMVDWYCQVLGYQKYFKHPEREVWILADSNGAKLEMMQKDHTERSERTVLTPGLSHLAFTVEDLEVAMNRLDQFNVNWLSPVVDAIGGGKLRSFADPEGNMLQIVQRDVD
ncbi:MAG: VOC family protein [Candidatus Cyclobacteriaceae bacterium M3_2C_046]